MSAPPPTALRAPPQPAAAPALTRAQLGMYVFLASDLMLFAPFFAAYFLLRTNAPEWPPEGVELDVPRAAIATAVLVASSFTMLPADRALEHGRVRAMQAWLVATLALGAAFLANQVAEYLTLDFGAGDHTYGSIYWLLTGLHSCHVFAGLAAIAALFARTMRAREPGALASWASGVSAFWHLVDVVWIGVFVTIWVVQ